MSEIAKEIERLAHKYRAQKKASLELEKSREEFDEVDLERLEKIKDDNEFQIADFINPIQDKNFDEKSLGAEKPRDQAMSLMRNIGKNLRDLKILIRG